MMEKRQAVNTPREIDPLLSEPINHGEEVEKEIIPKDRFKATSIILFIHGIGHLLPWYTFITAHEYFEKRFTCPAHHGNTTSSHCRGFQHTFENYFSIAATSSIVVSSAINIYVQSKVSFKIRMLAALLMNVLLFSVTAAMVVVPSRGWVDGFFGFTLVTIVTLGLFRGIFQSSSFGFAGMLPQGYTTVVMTGQACAGLFSSITRIVSTVVVKHQNVEISALIYFLSAVVVTLVCLVSFFILLRLEFVQYYMKLSSVKSTKAKQTITNSENADQEGLQPEKLPFWKIFKQILIYGLSVQLVFTVSIGLFPSVISSVRSTSIPDPEASIWTSDALFDALTCFLLFTTGDFIGRYVSKGISMPGRWKYVLITMAIARIVFVPLFLICNVQPRSDSVPVLLAADYWPIILSTLLGLSNGFFASLSMQSAPGCVDPFHRETASVIMAWFLALGLLFGGGISFLYIFLVNTNF